MLGMATECTADDCLVKWGVLVKTLSTAHAHSRHVSNGGQHRNTWRYDGWPAHNVSVTHLGTTCSKETKKQIKKAERSLAVAAK